MICFTGHRPDVFPWKYNNDDPGLRALKRAILDEILTFASQGELAFMSGMALGVDLWAAEMVLFAKEQGLPVTLHAAIPCAGQDRVWPRSSQVQYKSILDQCDSSVTLSERYTAACMQARNVYMVDHSNAVIAVHNGKQSGGTWNCIQYAKEAKKPIVYVALEHQPTYSDVMNHLRNVKELLR